MDFAPEGRIHAFFKKMFVSVSLVLGTELIYHKCLLGFPGDASGKEPACQCRRCKQCGFDLRVGQIPWRRAWKPTPVFFP